VAAHNGVRVATQQEPLAVKVAAEVLKRHRDKAVRSALAHIAAKLRKQRGTPSA